MIGLPLPTRVPPGEKFSPREVDILRLLAGGYSNREIARTIHLAEGTVKNYVSDILAKLGVPGFGTRAVLISDNPANHLRFWSARRMGRGRLLGKSLVEGEPAGLGVVGNAAGTGELCSRSRWENWDCKSEMGEKW